ncbi:hypothetical protein JXA27_03120 [Aerococcaceae bacterium zg-B36]|uniref:hypothetical protein n=1 Tax=Aerococcaceae bacterium zg-252 TaxID=2796928 RepID=UPI001BD8604B|nr:hypothetical protein [Aerococcaceae bacterium zg-B36]
MKKRMLLMSSLTLLSCLTVPIESIISHSTTSVHAQESTTIEEIYQVMTQQGPIRDEQFNMIPAEDWLRYASQAGRTMYMDNIFYQAYREHAVVFTSAMLRAFNIMDKKFSIEADKFNEFINNEFNALEVLMKERLDDGNGSHLNKELAQRIGLFKENIATEGVSELTREEAIARVKKSDEAEAMKITVLKLSSIPAGKLNQLTDDDFFEAAVVHAMKNPLGGDYGTQLAVFKSLHPELYTNTEKLNESLKPRTREEAIEYVTKYGTAETMKDNVLKLSSISADKLSQLTDDDFFEAAVVHAMKLQTGGDYGTQLAVFKSLHPELYTDMEELNESPAPRTREAAIEKVKATGLDKRIPSFLSAVFQQAIIDKIPESAFYEVAIQFFMTHTTYDDFYTVVSFFTNLYPEYFTGDNHPDDTIRQTRLEKIQKNQEKLTAHQTSTDKNYLTLKDNQTFNFDEGEFKITNTYLLVPGEAGNQSDNYLLGIHYQFTNQSKEDVVAPQMILANHSNALQFKNDNLTTLEPGTYRVQSEQSDTESMTVFDDIAIAKPQETIEGTLYYKVPNAQNDLVWSVIQHDKVNAYRFKVADLQKLPYQSASYTSNAGNQLGYLFDFERLYLVFSKDTDTSTWDNKDGVNTNLDINSLSKEANNHYNHLVQQLGKDIKLVALENVHYTLDNETIKVTLGENKESVLQLMTDSKWDSFTDNAENTYQLLSIH